MNFHDWLPQTRRNRIALALALLSLVCLFVWNFLPYFPSRESPQEGVVASGIWIEIFEPTHYLTTFRNPDLDGVFSVVASFMAILTALLALLTVPLWRFFETSALLCLPPAFMTLIGGIVVAKFGIESGRDGYSHAFTVLTLALISLNMLLASAALFLIKRENPPHPLTLTASGSHPTADRHDT